MEEGDKVKSEPSDEKCSDDHLQQQGPSGSEPITVAAQIFDVSACRKIPWGGDLSHGERYLILIKNDKPGKQLRITTHVGDNTLTPPTQPSVNHASLEYNERRVLGDFVADKIRSPYTIRLCSVLFDLVDGVVPPLGEDDPRRKKVFFCEQVFQVDSGQESQ
jgi:hypothetical protein